MSDLLELGQVLLALAWCWAIGLSLVGLVADGLPQSERHALGFLLGIGVVAFQLFMLSWLEMPRNPLLIVATGVPILVASAGHGGLRTRLLRFMLGRAQPTRCPASRASRCHPLAAASLMGLMLMIVAATVAALLTPSGIGNNPDGFSFYLLKARMFHLDGGIMPYFRNHDGIAYSVPDHPILMPLVIDWLYLSLGYVSQQHAALINPLILVSLITLFLGYARFVGLEPSMVTVLSALLGTSLLGFVRLVAYTDLAVGVYLFVTVSFVVRWLRDDRIGYAVVAAVALGFAAWTKNEGMAMYYVSVASLFVVAAHQLATKRTLGRRRSGWLVLVAMPYVIAWPWMLLKSEFAVHVIQGHVAGFATMPDLVERLVERTVPLTLWLAVRAGLLWHALLLLALGVLVINVGRSWRVARLHRTGTPDGGFTPAIRSLLLGVDPARLYIALLMPGMMVAYLVGMLTSPDPLPSLISHVTPRLVTQVSPLFFLILATELAAYLSHAPLTSLTLDGSVSPTVRAAAIARR